MACGLLTVPIYGHYKSVFVRWLTCSHGLRPLHGTHLATLQEIHLRSPAFKWHAACSRYPSTDTTTNPFSLAGLPAQMARGLLTAANPLRLAHGTHIPTDTEPISRRPWPVACRSACNGHAKKAVKGRPSAGVVNGTNPLRLAHGTHIPTDTEPTSRRPWPAACSRYSRRCGFLTSRCETGMITSRCP